jgi:dihydroorotate dehydrogenase
MYRLLRPLLFALDAEKAHELALGFGELCQAAGPLLPCLQALLSPRHPALSPRFLGLPMPGPVGLAAGMDKNARLLRFFAALGFGHLEVGSVSARPAPGNPRPRAFRLVQDQALVNRMGLCNDGMQTVAARLLRDRPGLKVPVGVNLAKTPDPSLSGDAAVDDFRDSFRLLAPLSDYVTLNVSCPNTEDGKTFAEPAALDRLLGAIFAERRDLKSAVPVLVKLPPPLPGDASAALSEVLSVVRAHGVAGLVLCNTAADRQGVSAGPERLRSIGAGGLSGRPLRSRSTALVQQVFQLTGGALPIVGVGGVDSAESAYEKIRAGASLVQLYTGLVYKGPGLVRRIHRGLLALLERDGLNSIAAAVGRDA